MRAKVGKVTGVGGRKKFEGEGGCVEIALG